MRERFRVVFTQPVYSQSEPQSPIRSLRDRREVTAGVDREASLDLGFGSCWRGEMANEPGELDTESLRLWFQSVDTDNSNSINVDELQVRRIAMLVKLML
jgi:hypothetical protein